MSHNFYIGFSYLGERFYFSIGRKFMRVELYFAGDKDKMKFDSLYVFRNQIEKQLPLVEWQRLDDKKASRIKLEMTDAEKNAIDGGWRDENAQQAYIDWCTQAMIRFFNVVAPVWEKAKNRLHKG